MMTNAPINVGKHITSNIAYMYALPTIHKRLNLLIGLNDAECYDITQFPHLVVQSVIFAGPQLLIRQLPTDGRDFKVPKDRCPKNVSIKKP